MQEVLVVHMVVDYPRWWDASLCGAFPWTEDEEGKMDGDGWNIEESIVDEALERDGRGEEQMPSRAN